MPMRERIAYSQLRAQGDATLRARREMLEGHRAALIRRQVELADLVAALDRKITQYTEMELQAEGLKDEREQTCHTDGGRSASHD